ncbi:MAG: permease [Thermostichus sp. HHBFW_bins_43]
MGLLDSPLWRDGFTLFLSIVVQAMPFLLLGVFLSGLLAVFVDGSRLARFLPKGKVGSAVTGGALGFFFPVCECGNLPVARQLVLKGIPPHVAVAFLLAAPVFNPVVIFSTWIAFRTMPEIVVYRILFSFGIAVVIGLLFGVQKDLQPLLHPAVWQELQRNIAQTAALPAARRSPLLQGGTFWIGSRPKQGNTPPQLVSAGSLLTLQTAEEVYRSALATPPRLPWRQKGALLLQTWAREIRELGSVLILGSAMAALIQTVIPRSFLLDYGQDALVSILIMMALAAIISICSTVDAFFALSFAATFTPGSLLAFMVFGPMVDLKAIGLMLTLFKPRAIFYLVVLTFQFTLVGALAINYFGG